MVSGCGSLFAFNGRHPIAVSPLTPGTPLVQSVPGKRDRRYTLAIQVVFDRDGVPEESGALHVEAKFPLAATLEDAKINGWLDPNEPPSVLYGQSTNPNAGRPKDVAPPELVVERLVGPVLATTDHALALSVDLGTDRVNRAHIQEARVVLYDDALPPPITLAFGAAAAGAAALLCGLVLFVSTLARKRRGGARPR